MEDDERRSGEDRRLKFEERLDEFEVKVEERLDEIAKDYTKRSESNRKLVQKLARWTGVILAVLAVAQIGLGLLSVKLLDDNGNQGDAIARSVKANAQAVKAIQAQRAEAVWASCRTQNYNHDFTIARLRTVVHAIKDPAQKARAEANTAATESILNALTPVGDCAGLLAERLHLKPVPLVRLTHRLEKDIGHARPTQREIRAATS